jgi:hypothetical protein
MELEIPRTSKSDTSGHHQPQSKRTRRDVGYDEPFEVSRSCVFGSVKSNPPTRFVGDGEYESWWLEVQAYLNLFDLAERDQVRLVHTFIGGAAKTMLLNEPPNNRATLVDIDRFLRQHFAVKVNWTGELFRTKQEPGESVKTYAARLKLIIFKSRAANHSYDSHANDLDFLEFFAANAQPELQDRLNLSMPSSTEAAMKIAVQWEREQSKKSTTKSERNKKTDSVNSIDDSLKADLDNRFKQLHDKVNTLSKKVQDQSSTVAEELNALLVNSKSRSDSSEAAREISSNGSRKPYGFQGRCWFCQGFGHAYTKCRKASPQDIQNIANKVALNARAASSNTRRAC